MWWIFVWSDYQSGHCISCANIPISIFLNGFNITKIATSAYSFHSLFINSTGNVFSCGANSVGQLGLGYTTWSFSQNPLGVPNSNIVIRSISSIDQNGRIATDISTGSTHSFKQMMDLFIVLEQIFKVFFHLFICFLWHCFKWFVYYFIFSINVIFPCLVIFQMYYYRWINNTFQFKYFLL